MYCDKKLRHYNENKMQNKNNQLHYRKRKWGIMNQTWAEQTNFIIKNENYALQMKLSPKKTKFILKN